MPISFTRLEVWARGVLITLVAVLAYLNDNETFRRMVSSQTLMVSGALLVALITIRGFIDKSVPKHDGAPQPVELTAKSPVPVAIEKPFASETEAAPSNETEPSSVDSETPAPSWNFDEATPQDVPVASDARPGGLAKVAYIGGRR